MNSAIIERKPEAGHIEFTEWMNSQGISIEASQEQINKAMSEKPVEERLNLFRSLSVMHVICVKLAAGVVKSLFNEGQQDRLDGFPGTPCLLATAEERMLPELFERFATFGGGSRDHNGIAVLKRAHKLSLNAQRQLLDPCGIKVGEQSEDGSITYRLRDPADLEAKEINALFDGSTGTIRSPEAYVAYLSREKRVRYATAKWYVDDDGRLVIPPSKYPTVIGKKDLLDAFKKKGK